MGSAITGFGVNSVGGYGMFIGSSGSDGLYVSSTGHHGVHVVSASNDGVNVYQAGTPSDHASSPLANGFEVDGAQGYGLYIGRADQAGIYVNSTGGDGVMIYQPDDDGLQVSTAGDDGVCVFNAGGDGLYVFNATDDGVDVAGTDLAGYFNGAIEVTGGCTGCVLATFGVNVADRPLEPGEVVAIQGVRPSGVDSVPVLWEVLPAGGEQAVVGVVQGVAELVTEDEPRPNETGRRLVPREGAVRPGEYLAIVIYGPVQVRVSAADGSIQPGMRQAVGESGAARALKMVVVEGLTLAESAPTIGIALAVPDENGLVWVLVNPQ